MADAIVIGGGPSGGAAAIALAAQGREVVLIEKAAFPRRKVCGEFLSATSLPVLADLGIGADWAAQAGPEVRRLALFAGRRTVEAPMPGGQGYGRALGRDVLDEMLLDRARALGVQVLQPERAERIAREGTMGVVTTASGAALRAPLIVAAHGSWERGGLPSHLPKQHAPGDLMGFKAHFHAARLAPDLMPLLAFRGGFGGMVWADAGRMSVSCCIRRDVLAEVRRPGEAAGETLERHLIAECRGVAEVLEGAQRIGPWLAAGPIRPGLRPGFEEGIFRVGNLAGEAHPVVAEGIAMAVQSGWMLARALEGAALEDPAALAAAGAAYERAWRRQFAGRIRAAALFSALTMHPSISAPLAGVVARAPWVLTQGARLSGKTRAIRPPRSGRVAGESF
ncbi:NAD(P)/FAD-dependent oxidoreductase [Pseudoroseicyclus aestuarii]|uniref:Flavin-dependent dehydrogenase n=1 Tax=Pseudoroseicyclus aestuarii TaxID=1795041 RepID=A0A318SSY2_9RHOB|nr:FAD-dependent monooxygenase [Pseudoroseicyclus aestuarii]PYE84823.1 flavin-dependent dehydrogenase [Pseudoroseicyclus aestuarii]